MNPENPAENNFDFAANCDELFTNVFHRINNIQTRFTVLYGGAGSSKSYSAHQYALLNIMQDGAGDTLVIRKFAADLRESCYKLFRQLIYAYRLQDFFKCTFSGDNRKITYLPNRPQPGV